MTPHIHLDGAEFIKFLLFLLAAGGLLRILEYLLHNTVIGKALAFIY